MRSEERQRSQDPGVGRSWERKGLARRAEILGIGRKGAEFFEVPCRNRLPVRRQHCGAGSVGRFETDLLAMKYMLIFHGSKADFDLRTDPVKGPVFWGEFMAYVKAIQDSGIMVSGAGLEVPENGKIVRIREGKNQVEDGPYAEAKESLAGFFLVEVPNMETAVDWAGRCPWAMHGTVEVRGVLAPGGR